MIPRHLLNHMTVVKSVLAGTEDVSVSLYRESSENKRLHYITLHYTFHVMCSLLDYANDSISPIMS